MQLACSGDDLLTALFDHTQHHGVRLRQTLQTVHQLRKIRCVLTLHGHPHHRRQRELHRTDVMLCTTCGATVERTSMVHNLGIFNIGICVVMMTFIQWFVCQRCIGYCFPSKWFLHQ